MSNSTTAIPHPTKADGVYDQLLQAIIEGTYAVRSKLPAEDRLAQKMGVSRPVLRTALGRLREDGIIVSQRGSGNFVARRPNQSVVNFVPLGSITDIQRCYEFRIDVEAAAAKWAALRRTDQDLEEMEAAYRGIDTSYLDQTLGVEADFKLHQAVARASQNSNFIAVLDSLAEQVGFAMNLSRSLTLLASPQRNALVQAEHRSVIDAIRSQDSAAAAQAMRDHLKSAWERMFEGG